jgi:hypothetical protein
MVLRFRLDRIKSFLRQRHKVDMVSIHRYAFPENDDPPTKDDLRNNSREWDLIIPALRSMIREQTGHDLPVAVTEVNSSWAINAWRRRYRTTTPFGSPTFWSRDRTKARVNELLWPATTASWAQSNHARCTTRT